ncbi:Nif11 family protein [Nostoc sp. FACHB-973]|uniref:Nif11-like leader peptide family natural product n=1 Tax=Desmonostoc muscorum LEGE 12446 TaxID=1828758 RepID=A0A8J7DAJ6_DESMC|nr:Nif11-like leader peptide family natural product precursor [Desmonostoc muscorum]MBD2518388.1 Nif11 family protein [Nostoc sp. FACHB-973]MBX9258917.1 Nif11 family protein [Desmonostoc muscorum CCALA 125]MCF2148820.1 Nif11-like leader peptide family natural product precursor [Desmonostoc muscorum LEGE 12446]
MYYQIWNFFLQEDKYNYWKERIKVNKSFNRVTWQKIIDFLSLVEQTFALKYQLGETDSLEPFLKLATENGYNLTAEELAWFLITRKQIWDLFDFAQKTPSLKEQLLTAKSPQHFVDIGAENAYYFSVDELAWLLTEIKSSSELVSINNSVGEILTVSNYGRIETGYWIWLAEDWGIVPPFCHRDKPSTFLSQNVNNPFLPDRCFLPKSYFNQRLMAISN